MIRYGAAGMLQLEVVDALGVTLPFAKEIAANLQVTLQPSAGLEWKNGKPLVFAAEGDKVSVDNCLSFCITVCCARSL